jgi:hypothetical protein
MRHSTIEHERYWIHALTECEGDLGNFWCRTCEELCLLADAADWKVIRVALTPEPATVG